MNLIALMLALGCPPPVSTDDTSDTDADADTDTDADSDTDADADTDTDTDTDVPDHVGAVFTTSNFEVGSLAVVDLATQSISEPIDIPSDAAVAAEGGMVFLLGRYGYDYVRVYEPGSWTTPELEFSVGDGANPQDIEVCGDKLFVSSYGKDALSVHDASTGNVVGAVDLSAYNDGDGVGPEPTQLVEANDMLYVALNGLDQANGWVGVGGRVVEIDCATEAVTQAWDVGGNTAIHPWEGSGQLFATHEGFGEVPAGLSILDPSAGTLTTVLSYDAWTTQPLSVVESEGQVLVTMNDASYNYGWQCFDGTTWEASGEATWSNWFLGSAVRSTQGQAWIPAGSHWSNTADQVGVVVVDPIDCGEVGVVPTELGGTSVALY